MTRRAIRWSLLLPMAAFVPLLFYMFVVGGFLPYTAILVFTLRNLSNHSLLLFNAVHLIVYGLLLYLAAGSIARLICRLPERRRLVITGLIVLILAFVGFQPIFGAGHGSFEFKNAFQIYGVVTMTGAPSNYGMQRTAIIAALLPWRYRDAADAGRSADSSWSRSLHWVRRSRSLSDFRRVGRAEILREIDAVIVADAG